MKALFINGSPRKNGNTAQLLKRAMDGAREAGAEVELVNLYPQSELQGLYVVFRLQDQGRQERSLLFQGRPAAHTPEGCRGRCAGVRFAQLLRLPLSSPSCFYGANGVSCRQLL